MSFGRLFTEDFLSEGVDDTAEWKALDAVLAEKQSALAAIFNAFPITGDPNEAETEERLVYPVADLLGWTARSVQQAVERGRREIPDALLFLDKDDQAKADAIRGPEKHRHADLILEAKRWGLALDKAGGRETPPSAQLLNYLSRAEVQSDGRILWGVLTNGRMWRLYWRRAKSLLTDYFEIDLGAALGVCEPDDLFGPQSEADRTRDLKLFLLFFSRDGFDPSLRTPRRSFHALALEKGRYWEARVTERLREVVFDTVYPSLTRALCDADPEAPEPLTPAYLAEVREATFTFLYRLLFTLYAEDRDLLPKEDPRYDEYSLSKKVRDDIARRVDQEDTFSSRRGDYYRLAMGTFRTIDEGDPSAGVPPYNGGLFSKERAPLLARLEVADDRFAPLLDALSRTEKEGRRVRVSYRDLSVRELGSIYERLLEFEAVADPAAPSGIAIRLNPFARKGSGSYYTPDELVELIVERTLKPLIDERVEAFIQRADELRTARMGLLEKGEALKAADPAKAILELKICDPAMGSGHFLVALVDYLSDQVFEATQTAFDAVAAWGKEELDYHSPILKDAAQVRERILEHAGQEGWTVRPGHVSDEAIVRRMVLKRCVYGVDKNPMAVELAKVGLWLHTLTAGAPLSFLDHHLRCGDSLFGEKVRDVRYTVGAKGGLFLTGPLALAEGAVKFLSKIEVLTDADMDEAKESAAYFADVRERTEPLQGFFSFMHALKWLDLTKAERRAVDAMLDGQFGDTLNVASLRVAPKVPKGVKAAEAEAIDEALSEGRDPGLPEAAPAALCDYAALAGVLSRVRQLVSEERFLHWELAFPGVWSEWSSAEPKGGFDAIVGNPPWDRMKMQEVEWFAARAPEIARKARAADRKAAIKKLEKAGDPLAGQYALARGRAERGVQIATKGGAYPLLGRGDVNLYSLFVERGLQLIRPSGFSGLLVPSGIASDKTASTFFQSVSTSGRVRVLYDFENRGRYFPEVHRSFKFCAFVVGGTKRGGARTQAGFFLQDPPRDEAPDKLFSLSAEDFALVNPNTGTAPIFRTQRDAQLTTAIYRRLPVLVNRSGDEPVSAWPVKYARMFDMTNDSGLFWTREALEGEGAYPMERGRWKKGEREWVPLYEGKLCQAFDHRAANIVINPENLNRPAQETPTSAEDKGDPDFTPAYQYWVEVSEISAPMYPVLGFKDVTAPTNVRTMIAAIIPNGVAGNTLPIIEEASGKGGALALIAGCFNSLVFDYCARQKVQGQHLNWYIVEQLPVIPEAEYQRRFGPNTAAEIMKDHVLRLTYTAWDMEPFARDLGYGGEPFTWDEADRRHLRARLDALYFHLYGVTDPEDVRYILSTFPIVERKDRQAFEGVYMTEELILWYMRALAAGDVEADAPEAALIRAAKAKGAA
jgi:hypothetical protein